MKIDEIRNIYKKSYFSNREISNEIKGFNWAAFLLTFVWGIPNKAWITLLAIPLIWIQLPYCMNWFLLLVFQIYCGVKGNEWAYQAKSYSSVYEFNLVQLKWTIFAVLLNVAIPCICLVLGVIFIRKIDINEFAHNAQCSVANKKLQTKPIRDISYKSEAQIAKEFSDKFKNAKPDNNSVNFFISGKENSLDLYYITFYKNSKHCNLSEQNCVIKSGFSLPTELYEQNDDCTFYFDDYFNVVPALQTKSIIQKGYNIFRYL